MAFVSKKDYCGCAVEGKLGLASDTMGASVSDVTAPNDAGDTVAYTTVDGGRSPSNTYDIMDDVPFTGSTALALGTVNTVDGKEYMLTGVNFGTQAGAASTFSASATDVEAGAETGVVYKLPNFTLPKTHKAALLFSEVTLSGAGCNLTQSQYAASVQPGVDRDEMGVPFASSPNGGVLTATLTINQTSSTVPTVTAATGWHISTALTQTNGKGAYPTWTVGLTYYLTRVEPSA